MSAKLMNIHTDCRIKNLGRESIGHYWFNLETSFSPLDMNEFRENECECIAETDQRETQKD